jgi:hypothetical protein
MHLPFAPKDEDEKKGVTVEFERVIKAGCRTDRHVTAVIDNLMDHSATIPAPAAIMEACQATVAPENQKAPLGCEICRGSGFKHLERGVYEYCAFCVCDLGRWKNDAYEQRKAAAREKGHAMECWTEARSGN